MTKLGFLLVLMQPPPSLEDEFNAWYDSEHLPERLAVPGFRTALRFVCLDGHPRYLAMYDLDNATVLDSAAYKKVAFENSSPWTKRVTSRVKIYRSTGEQIYPHDARPTGPCARLTLVRYRGLKTEDDRRIVISGMRQNFEERPEVSQTRVLAFDNGAAGTDYLGLVEARGVIAAPLDTRLFGAQASAIDLVNTYAPY